MNETLILKGKKVTYFHSPENSKPVLVVLNGWSTSYSNWYMVRDTLKQNFQVVSPKFPDFGGQSRWRRQAVLKIWQSFWESL